MFFNRQNNKEEIELRKAAENLRKGSAEAFKILYDNYQHKVYRYCLRILNSEALAKDAFQETFINVYEHRFDFQGKNFAAWLFTIARNSCMNILRNKRESGPSLAEDSQDFQLTENEDDFGLKQYIGKAIAMLPLPFREALVLREYQEYSYQEIAEILKIDVSLAKIRVYRARLILRKLLKPIHKELYES
ncbi:MAG: sigma-70 family RNA polymerase sigma factor [Candidatus Kapabacteria bacterium]|nr:sigma-70 family RNA polymerase sigma factor [Candidatus Kapabacteria bacterium]